MGAECWAEGANLKLATCPLPCYSSSLLSSLQIGIRICTCSSQVIRSAVTVVTTRGTQTHFSVRFYLISTLPGWIWFLPLWYSLKYFLKNAFIWRQQTCLSSEDSCNSFFGSIVDCTKTKPICVFVCFQETEEELAESEEYKEARSILDSVKLEGWFLMHFCSHCEIHLLKCPFLSSGLVWNRGGQLNPFKVSFLDVIISFLYC